jgi:Domain of unknown function (DUF4386)
MTSLQRQARLTGLLYLFMGLIATVGLLYVPGKLIVRGDVTATASNIATSQSLYRLGVVSQLISGVMFIFLALALYQLLKGVNRSRASLMVTLILVQIPIVFLNEANALAALTLVRGADFLSAIDKPQRDALAMLFLRLHNQGLIVSEMFWGLWLFPFGLLVFRSVFLPRILGIWLIVNGAAYVIISLTGVLWPTYYDKVFQIAFPALLGEMGIMSWLVIRGARPQPLEAPATP